MIWRAQGPSAYGDRGVRRMRRAASTMRTARALILPALLTLALTACVGAIQSEPVATFGFGSAPVSGPAPGLSRQASLALEPPRALGLLAGDRLIVEVGARREVVAGVRWEDRIPDLLLRQIARTLQPVEGLDVVDEAQRGGRADFALVTALEAMQVTVAEDLSGAATMEISARLVRLPGRDIIATDTFRGEARAADDAPETLATAIDEATAAALSALRGWTVREIAGTN